MARRSGAPKQPVKATLSRQDMTSGIKKLERRLKELDDFDLDTLDPDDPELKKLEDRVQMAITDIFGQGTIQYKQFHVSSLTSWSKRGIIAIGGYKSPQVTHAKNVEDKRKGVREAVAKLEAAKDHLTEHIEDLVETPGGQAIRAIEEIDLHPSIAKTCSQKFRDGHYADAIETACKTLIGLVRIASSIDDLDGDKLMRKVFSANTPILAFNDLSTETDKSEQRGMMELYAGAISAFRNPRAHELVNDDPDFSLKTIAFISFLAELLDKTEYRK